MISHGGPGLRVPRRRVEVSDMWLPENTDDSCWQVADMCKPAELNGHEIGATAYTNVGRLSNGPLTRRDDLGRNYCGTPNCASGGESFTNQEFVMQEMLIPDRIQSSPVGVQTGFSVGPQAYQLNEDTENFHGNIDSRVEEGQDLHPEDSNEIQDSEVDIEMDDVLKILREEPIVHQGAAQILQASAFAPTHSMRGPDMNCFSHDEREASHSGIRQIKNSASGSMQEFLQTSHRMEEGFLPYPACTQRTGHGSVHEEKNPGSGFIPDEISWPSSLSALHEGSVPHASPLASAAPLSTIGSNAGNQSYKTSLSNISANFGAFPTDSGAGIDDDRPRQTNGSVLASERESNVTLLSPSSSMPVRAQSNIVDLTEDSDDDEVNNNYFGGHCKRKMDVNFESDKKKKLSVEGQQFEDVRRDDYNYKLGSISSMVELKCPEKFSKQHFVEMVPRMESSNLKVNLLPYPGNFASPSLTPTSKVSSLFLSQGLPLVAKRPVTVARSQVKSLANTNSMQRTLTVFPKDEATVADGLMSVCLLKHQRIALAWMEKRESELNVQGGILADDQGLGKTVSTISLILKLRAPIQKSSLKALDSPRLGDLTVELEDDDDDLVAGNIQNTGAANENVDSSLTSVGTVLRGPDIKEICEDMKLTSSKCRPAAGTLIVCPTSVIKQWEHELKEKVTDEAGLSVLTYHGSNRTRDPDELTKYDVVLSTYSIVSMEVPKQPLPEDKEYDKKIFGSDDLPPQRGGLKSKKIKKPDENVKKSRGLGRKRLVEGENGLIGSGPLARVTWFRVVLDEAQSIKNSRTQVARATWGLRAKRRWCLSGTPIQNAIEDLYSYFRFLRYSPYDSYKIFQEQIKEPVTRSPTDGYKNLQKLLFGNLGIMLRRTKGCEIDGRPIVDLPPRIVTLKQAEFSDEERTFYNILESESRKQFQDYAAAGTLQRNYVNILWMLLRLRQACDHPLLVKGQQSQSAQKIVVDSARSLPVEKRKHLLCVLESNRSICTICNDLPDEAVVCVCAHVFCEQCISEQLATGDDTCCPIPKCRKSLNLSQVFNLASLKRCEVDEGCTSSMSLQATPNEECNSSEVVEWKSSSKIDAVIDTLKALPQVIVVVENGKVVVQASKNLDDLRLLDTSGVKFLKQEPSSLADIQSDLPGKLGATSVGESESGSGCTVMPGATYTGRIEKKASRTVVKEEISQSVQGAIKTEIVTVCPAVDRTGQHEPVSTDIIKIEEPHTRHFVKSTEKAIVFSQWTSMLDLLEVGLKEAKFNYRRLDGTMSVGARDRALADFKLLPEVTVIIMSLKAASLGLNMVAACHVLLLDVWWNPTTEDQAIDRAHRIGQTRTVSVSRFTVKNTIEDRILLLQEKKRQMCAEAFGESYTGGQHSKLTPGDFQFLFKA